MSGERIDPKGKGDGVSSGEKERKAGVDGPCNDSIIKATGTGPKSGCIIWPLAKGDQLLRVCCAFSPVRETIWPTMPETPVRIREKFSIAANRDSVLELIPRACLIIEATVFLEETIDTRLLIRNRSISWLVVARQKKSCWKIYIRMINLMISMIASGKN